MKSLIQKLVEIPGPSGYEMQIRAAVQVEIEPFVSEVKIDPLGNLIAHKGAASGGLKIMFAAHMDEIGIMVTHVDENGFIRFTNIGSVYLRTCIGGRVRFLNGTVGVIGIERTDNRSEVPPVEKMFIDIGAADRKDCPVRVGDVAAFDRPFIDMGDRLVAKAMDDRIGVVVLIETLRQLNKTPHQLYFVFSAQEEVGTRGAITAAYALEPDLGLAVDVTSTGDTPKGIKMDVSLGKGPAIKVRDTGMLSDPRVVDWMVRVAQKAHIPYQFEVLGSGSTDARSIQIARAGVPSGCLSVPCRYIHTPSEMVDYSDVQNAVRLLMELLSGEDKPF